VSGHFGGYLTTGTQFFNCPNCRPLSNHQSWSRSWVTRSWGGLSCLRRPASGARRQIRREVFSVAEGWPQEGRYCKRAQNLSL